MIHFLLPYKLISKRTDEGNRRKVALTAIHGNAEKQSNEIWFEELFYDSVSITY